MLYRLAADLVLLIHLGFILFMALGGFLAWRWRWVAWIHVPSAAYGVAISLQGWICPLTPLENDLRRMAGDEGFEGSFIEHYVLQIIYPPGLTPTVQVILATILVVLMVVSYGGLFVRTRAGR